MTARQLIELLQDRYPDENVTIRNESGRYLQIDGIDDAQSMLEGCIVLRSVWSYADKPVESEEDKLRRQREDITKQLAKMKADEAKEKKKASARAKAGAKTRKKKTKKTRSASKQIASGYVPTGKRGRPRKMVEDTEFILDLAEKHELQHLAKKVTKSAVHSTQTTEDE